MKKNIFLALVLVGLVSQTALANLKDIIKTYLFFGDKKKSGLVWGSVIVGGVGMACYRIKKAMNKYSSN